MVKSITRFCSKLSLTQNYIFCYASQFAPTEVLICTGDADCRHPFNSIRALGMSNSADFDNCLNTSLAILDFPHK